MNVFQFWSHRYRGDSRTSALAVQVQVCANLTKNGSPLINVGYLSPRYVLRLYTNSRRATCAPTLHYPHHHGGEPIQ